MLLDRLRDEPSTPPSETLLSVSLAVEDLDALARWRAFIAEECGVELTIRA